MTALTLRADDLAALHRCATDGSLELLYQPEVDLQTGAIVAMEGLLRWHRGDEGMLAPLAFLDLAEDSGDIGAIGAWVMRAGGAGGGGGGAGRGPRGERAGGVTPGIFKKRRPPRGGGGGVCGGGGAR